MMSDTMLEQTKNIMRNARECAGFAMVAMTYITTGGPGIAKAPFIKPDSTPVLSETVGEATRSLASARESATDATTTEIPIHS